MAINNTLSGLFKETYGDALDKLLSPITFNKIEDNKTVVGYFPFFLRENPLLALIDKKPKVADRHTDIFVWED